MFEQNFLPPKQAAFVLKLSVRTLEKWRTQGIGPQFHKFGNRIRYSESDLAAWVSRTAQNSTSV
jgi:hypothetical protein